jgi:hypothetical protein
MMADEESAILGFLAGAAGSGKTELGENAGTLEAWVIATDMAKAAGEKVWKLGEGHVAGPVLLLGKSDSFNPAAYQMVRGRTQMLRKTLEKAIDGADCARGITTTGAEDVIAKLAGLMQQDVKVSDKIIDPSEQFWINAVAGTAPAGKTVYLASSLVPNPEAQVVLAWQKLYDDATKIDGECLKKNEPLKQAVGLVEATQKSFSTAGEGKLSPLESASAFEPLLSPDGPGQLTVLRTSIEKAGGTVIQTKNILTTLGLMPAVTMSGGIIVTYQYQGFDAKQGGPLSLKAAGNFACTGPMRTLTSANNRTIRTANCPEPMTDQPMGRQ